MENEVFSLLKEWCDRLLSLQITEIEDTSLSGALLCPACNSIHGRCADAVYPLLLMSDATGESCYAEAAKQLVEWTERNVLRQDGSYYNDVNNPWRGITVFSCIAISEALLHHGHVLDCETRGRWEKIVNRQANFLYHYFTRENYRTNINYVASCAAALACVWKLGGNEKYKTRAAEWIAYLKGNIAPDFLITGEYYNHKHTTEKGCKAVDLGYNVEETLPNLVLAAQILGDRESMDVFARSMAAHLEFMLPDGAWDNSWGCRHAKWTYYGSRTTDGCQLALVHLLEQDPVFGEAAWRNFMLYRRLTGDGLLYGGAMYREAGEPPCIHHTFCHAKALAAMLNTGFKTAPRQSVALPREKEYGVRYFESVHVHLISKFGWKATISDYDMPEKPSGGALTILWHNAAGPLCAASMNSYSLVEPYNMQMPRHSEEDFCQTPRIEYLSGGKRHMSINDTGARVSVSESQDAVNISVSGHLLRSENSRTGVFSLRYIFSPDSLRIRVLSEDGGEYILPLVSSYSDEVRVSGDALQIRTSKAVITVEASVPVRLKSAPNERRFNPVGGFLTLPIYAELKPGEEIELRLRVTNS